MKKFFKMIKDTKGATAIEYGLIAALIAVAAISAMQGLGSQLGKTFTNVSSSMGGAATPAATTPATTPTTTP
ncbi:MAG TPA: Flp family type IVb pilin [Sphingomonadaceae bacterium]|nr:Flp family type IVb pilin [Sphingomonadaceae bacterium]